MEISYFAIIIGAIFVNNVVLAQFLGICPFLGVSSKVETSLGMGAAVTFVMALTAVVAWPIQTYILVPLHIEYMQTIVFILVIAALVQMVEIMLKKLSPSLYQALGIFLPLITTNCAVLGVAILMIQKEFNLLQSVAYSVSTALGFALALVLFAGIRERLEFEEVPKGFREVPNALITANILATAIINFSDLIKDTETVPPRRPLPEGRSSLHSGARFLYTADFFRRKNFVSCAKIVNFALLSNKTHRSQWIRSSNFTTGSSGS